MRAALRSCSCLCGCGRKFLSCCAQYLGFCWVVGTVTVTLFVKRCRCVCKSVVLISCSWCSEAGDLKLSYSCGNEGTSVEQTEKYWAISGSVSYHHPQHSHTYNTPSPLPRTYTSTHMSSSFFSSSLSSLAGTTALEKEVRLYWNTMGAQLRLLIKC